jgi:hypothetical protein
MPGLAEVPAVAVAVVLVAVVLAAVAVGVVQDPPVKWVVPASCKPAAVR